MLQTAPAILQNYNEAIEQEWLETNGLGGWSSSSVIGSNTRRYHGLLVAATNPPAERMALVSKLDETIVCDGQRFELATNNYGDVVHPQGFQYVSRFLKDLFPVWIYEAGEIQLQKTIAMIHGENTVVIIYKVLKSPAPFTLELLPLLSVRGYHAVSQANEAVQQQYSFVNDVFHTRLYDGTPDIFFKVPSAGFAPDAKWFYHFNYSVEKYRGLDYMEDLYAPGTFNVNLQEGETLGIIISTGNPVNQDAHNLLENETRRRQALLPAEPVRDITRQLILAADQFIVKRGDHLKTIIAGYHWFTDWGRDTMISLPGLCLSTGRFTDAKKILSAFAQSVSMGMLPNRFQDNNEPPEYNNVDGTLWYFIAVHKYLEATGDSNFILNDILPVLKEIIDWHFKGTRFNIHVDEDGLLYAGEQGQQLTWMDARIGSWVVTPRMGKPVEIQALWYNALQIFAHLLLLNQQETDAAQVIASAQKAKNSFTGKFWWTGGNYLFDLINEFGEPITDLRPNQLLAISLPFPLIEGEQAKMVLQAVEDQLYTPVGLRTLPKTDQHYIPVYGGDAYHRDSAYHEGTVWSWLLGPYIDALIKVHQSPTKAIEVINAFSYHMNEGCIGSVSEIFDAEPPHHPRGCIAQAWGVAELLRVITDHQLLKNSTGDTTQTELHTSLQHVQTD